LWAFAADCEEVLSRALRAARRVVAGWMRTRFRRWPSFGFFLALATAGVACSSGPECNQIGCLSGLEIHATSRELLVAGTYEIAVELDDVSGTCMIIFPRTTELSQCDPGLPMTVHWQSAGFILSVLMRADDIGVTVRRDGELLGQGTYAPEYRTIQTDRSLCSPTCEIARPEVLPLGS
jgi:hypothetical protein